MRLLGPYRWLAVSTLIGLGLIALLSTNYAQPISPDCFEWCGLERILATAGISVVVLTWLLILLATSWFARDTAPGLSVTSAFMSSLAGFSIIVASLVPWSPDSYASTFLQLLLILSLGVQLPAAWRLARRARRSFAGGLASMAMGLATSVAAFAYVALGTDVFAPGPGIQLLAHLAFSAGLALLAVASWPLAGGERIGLTALAAGSLLFLATVGYSALAPGNLYPMSLVAFPVIGLGWAWIGWTWVRAPGRHQAISRA